MSFLQVSDLHITAATGPVLRGISFAVQPLQHLAICGATGSGKSSLLKAIAGLAQPTGGQVIFENKRVLGPDERLLPGHPHIGYLSQHFELRNNYRVEEELECVNQMSTEEAAAIYRLCEVDHLLRRRTNQLSGGEKQRIVTARLLTTKPRLLLLDEPFSNLDPDHKQVMQRVIDDIGERLGITCVLVTHEPADSLPWAHRIMAIRDGQMVQEGSPYTVYNFPVDPYVAGLLGPYNRLDDATAEALGLPEWYRIVRPENVRVATAGGLGIQATVEQVRYFGSHYELRLRVAGSRLTARTRQSGWQDGDPATIQIHQPPIHD